MDVNQIVELGKQYWPYAMGIILAIGDAISWHFSIQKSPAEREKVRAETEKVRVETQKLRIEVRKLQAEEQLQLESLRKGETGYQPSETTSKREFPNLLKANRTTTANIGFALLALIVFFVDLFSSPLTAYVLANMMFLLFGALLNLLIVGFQILQRQEENNFRIQNWISIKGQLINLELTKIQHAANVEIAKIQHAANVELTKTTLDLIARAGDEIIEQIKKLREFPGNHPSQTTNPVKPEYESLRKCEQLVPIPERRK